MNEKGKSLNFGKLFFTLSLIIFLLLFPSLPHLAANFEPIPVSGTPKLLNKNPNVTLEYEIKSTLFTEKNGRQEYDQSLDPNFWAYDFTKNQYYETEAILMDSSLLSNGYHLFIYLEMELADRQAVSTFSIQEIQREFATNIFPRLTFYFGNPPPKDFTILILDIRDDYNPAIGNNTYVSGYFDYRNEYNDPYSNNRSMIYLDANPGVPGSIISLGTLAHEYQHFIHYYYDPLEETWVNEGLSGLARYVCGYGHRKSHIEAFAKYPNTSLTIWNDSLANYGATYLFMLYLTTHYGGPTITRNIVANSGRGIVGINNALWQNGYYGINFDNIFRNWVIANYLNNSSVDDEIYGYNDNFEEINPAPGNLQITKTHTSYPATGSGLINPYAADYVNFCFLGGIYDIFVLVVYSTAGGSYAYSGNLGSFFLHLEGISEQLRISGIQESTSGASPIVWADLSPDSRFSTMGGLLGESSEGGCFIATALYGSRLSKEISILREFRDQFLLPNNLGKKTVDLYYRYSPLLARFISQSERVKSMVRILIYPLFGLSYALLRYPLSSLISLIICAALLLRKFFYTPKKRVIILKDE